MGFMVTRHGENEESRGGKNEESRVNVWETSGKKKKNDVCSKMVCAG